MKIARNLHNYAALFFGMISLLISFPKPASASTYYEYENNNSMALANTITVDSEVYGSNSDRYDLDYYKFSAPYDGYVTVNINHKRDYATHRVELYDADQQKFFDFDIDTTSTKASSPEVAVKKGINYIKIFTPYSENKESYSFISYFTASDYWEKEFNNKFDTANTIGINTTYYGSNVDLNDLDYYKFNAPYDGFVTVNINHKRDYATHRVELYDEDQQKFFDFDIDTTGTKSSSPEIGVKKGLNYIKVFTPYSKNREAYSFTTYFKASDYWEKEFNNKFDTANTIEINTTYYGSNSDLNDMDYYIFNAPYDGFVTVDINHKRDYATHRVELYDADQQKYFDFYIDSSGTKASSTEFAVKKGINYIKILTPYSKNKEAYSFCINMYKGVVVPSVSLSKTKLIYTGKTIKPSVKVSINGKALSSSEYALTFSGSSVNVGSYSVRVDLKGTYRGSKTVSYMINPPKMTFLSVTPDKGGFTAKWIAKTPQTSGYHVQYATDSSFKNQHVVGSDGDTKNSRKIIKQPSNKKYYVRMRIFKKIGNKVYYGPWTEAKTVVTK